MKRREFIALVAGASAWLLPWTRLARAQDPVQADQTAANQIGQVATLQGNATVTRANTATAIALRVNDPVFKNDTLATAVNSTLGVTFDDQTTFSLSANTRIVVNEFVYAGGRRCQRRVLQCRGRDRRLRRRPGRQDRRT